MHNEEEVLPTLFARLLPCLAKITPDFEIICVSEGSREQYA